MSGVFYMVFEILNQIIEHMVVQNAKHHCSDTLGLLLY